MNKRQLQYFLEVMDTHSIKKAADNLVISSQGLSKMIKDLEKDLDVVLFTRTSHGVLPTIQAMSLKRSAENIIREFDYIQTSLFTENEEAPTTLRVLSTYGMMKYLTLDFILDFYSLYPNIRLNLVEYPENPIIAMLRDEQIDIAFLPTPIDNTIFYAAHCSTHRHCLIIHKQHPLAKKPSIEYEDLRNVPLALKGREFNIYANNINRFLKNGVTPEILLETSEDRLIHEVARKNLGIGVSLDFIAFSDRDDATVIRPFSDVTCVKDVFLVTKKGKKLSSNVVKFQDFTLQWIQHHKDQLFKWL